MLLVIQLLDGTLPDWSKMRLPIRKILWASSSTNRSILGVKVTPQDTFGR